MKSSPIKVSLGGALMAAAQTYPFLIDFILENIQNSIDAGGQRIRLVINLQRRFLQVMDDGRGVSQAKFEQALSQIFLSMKTGGQLGQFGRGLLSPLGKCHTFTFTSCGQREGVYRTWTFETDRVAKMKQGEGIPFEVLPHLRFSRTRKSSKKASAQHNFVPWRTKVHVKGITKDRQLGRLDLDSLESGIIDKYGTAMFKRGVTVEVLFVDADGNEEERLVKAKEFDGQALEEVVYEHEDCGETTLRLFVARKDPKKQERRGKVLFGQTDNDFRLNTASFWNSISGLMDNDVIEVLKSGVFEGEIVCQGVDLHPDRKKFNENDALKAMCECIEKWYLEVGADLMDEIVTSTKEVQRQVNGLAALEVVEGILATMGLQGLKDAFTQGTIGQGHTDLPDKGQQPSPALAIHGREPKTGEGDHGDRERSDPHEEKQKHHPSTVRGPKGRQRRIVKSSSTGIQFNYDTVGMDPYAFDSQTGILTFNVSHKYWQSCDNTDVQQIRYQELVAQLALTEFMLAENGNADIIHRTMLELLGFMVVHIVHGDRLRINARRKSRRK